MGLVRLSVTVRTPAGALVHDLGPDEFQVFDEGALQEILRFGHHETPMGVVVLFDKSESMHEEKLIHAKDAVVSFVRAFHAQDEVLVNALSDGIDVLGDFGLEPRTIERAPKTIRVEGSTRLYYATIEGAGAIAGPGRKEKRAPLILSDGEDTASETAIGQAVESVRKAGVPVYAIGIEMDADDPKVSNDPAGKRGWPSDNSAPQVDPLWRRSRQVPPWARGQPSRAIRALTRLTDGTGGRTYPVVAAKRCKEVCLRVAEELRNQYPLGYSPPSPSGDGGWRTMEVRT